MAGVIVSGSIASLKVAVSFAFVATSVAAAAPDHLVGCCGELPGLLLPRADLGH